MPGIESKCSKRHYPAFHKSGTRPISDIKWIVMHDTESGANTADSVANYFQSPNSGGSTHLVIDDNECYRCLSNTTIPWGAQGANTYGFHIELCAKASWHKAEWLLHGDMLDRAAYKAAFHCKLFNLPTVFVNSVGLGQGKKGITTHAECTKAFGGSHTDPGPGFPMDIFIKRVKEFYNGM